MMCRSVLLFSTVITISFLGIAHDVHGQTDKNPFRDIENEKVLPMLQYLPRQHGGMNVPPEDGRLLYDIIVERGYKRGLEIGTSNGYSGLWLGMAFQKTGGKLITLEIEPNRAKEAMENFTNAGLDGIIDSRICDAFKEIPSIEGEFDFIFIDAWKNDYMAFLNLVKDRVPKGGVITGHNVINGRYEMQDFLQAIQTDSRYETTIHKVSGQGISVSYIK